MLHFLRLRAGGSGDDIYGDPKERERAIRYSRTREWLVLAGTIWSVGTSIFALATGLSAALRDRVSRLAPRRLGPIAPFTAIAIVLSSLASLPLSYYGGFVVEHRYGLSNQTRRSWLMDQLKGLGVALALAPALAQGAFWIIARYPKRWWAILSALTIPFSVLLTNLAPVLLLPIFNKFEPLRDRALARRLEDLAAGQGVRVSDVLQMDMSRQTKKANAFFTGVGNTKRIVLGDTMLDEFSADEIEVVLAHELGHQVHRDLWKLIGLGSLVSLINFYAVYRLSGPAIERFGHRWRLDQEKGMSDAAALPLFGLLAGGVSLALSPAVNGLIRRYIEHEADHYALDLTGKRGAFLSAMKKLGRMNLSDPAPPAIVKHLLYDHPTLAERIAYGESWQQPAKR